MRRSTFVVIAAIVLGLGVGPAEAAPITFLGQDTGLGELTRLPSHPNADAARAAFFANLSGVGTENFEGAFTGVADFGGGLTAALVGGTLSSQPTGTNGAGRYPISGTQYYQTASGFTLTFSQAISAFGFYGVDIGDFNGQVTLQTVSGTPIFLNIGNSTNVPGGGVLYFGFYTTDANEAFTSISFGNTASGTDIFAFDDFSIGTLAQVEPAPVPEPASMLLMGTGVLGLAARARRRRKQ